MVVVFLVLMGVFLVRFVAVIAVSYVYTIDMCEVEESESYLV